MKELLKRLLGAPGAPSTAKPSADEKAPRDWKAKAADAIARAKAFEAEAQREAKRAEKFKAAAERLQKQSPDFEKLRERLLVAERELTVAREHLMAVEVKLDILEGAANVLDARTRLAIRPQPRETGVSA